MQQFVFRVQKTI